MSGRRALAIAGVVTLASALSSGQVEIADALEVQPAHYPPAARVEFAAARLGEGDAVDIATTMDGRRAYVVYESGAIATLGDASVSGAGASFGGPETAVAIVPVRDGLELVSSTGRVVPVGAARSYGDLSATRLQAPIVDAVATPSGLGYWLLGADGGVFAFGDATFVGSTAALRLNRPADGMVADPDGRGYWFVAEDGGVFAFDALFRGSMGSAPLNRPVVAMAPFGQGYLLVAQDGGVFSFAGDGFFGSLGDDPAYTADDPVVSATALADGSDYLLLHRSGRVSSFGTHPAWIDGGPDLLPSAGQRFVGTGLFSRINLAAFDVICDGPSEAFPNLAPLVYSDVVSDLTTTLYQPTQQPGPRSSRSGCGASMTADYDPIFLVLDGRSATGAPIPSHIFRIQFGGAIRDLRPPTDFIYAEMSLAVQDLGETSDPAGLIRRLSGT